MFGCDSPTSPGGETPNPPVDTSTLRYETVPLVPSAVNSSMARAEGEIDTDNLMFSAYDDDSYYYVFLLGHVNRVPLAYRPAVEYNGTTPITIVYSAANVTETSITDSVEYATENSVTGTFTNGWEVGAEIGMSFIADSKAILKYTGSYSTEEMSSRSTSNTYETASTKSSEITDEISATIGGNNEPPGMYRYSLFTTTDVYHVIITNHAKELKKVYTAWCARPTSFWAIDYDSEIGGSFRKTAAGALLKVPEEMDLSALPTPTDNDVSGVPAEYAATPVADKTEGSYDTSVTVTLTTETPDASIYYTTNGNAPTTSSTLYSGPITITNTTTLKAIAAAAGMENSTVMTETYTITDPVLQTVWAVYLPGAGTRVKDSDNSHVDYIDLTKIGPFAASSGFYSGYEGYKNFELAKLKAEGYTFIYIWINYGGKEINDGYALLSVKKGLGGNGPEWLSGKNDLNRYGWTVNSHDATISIDNFEMQFTMNWSATGDYSDDWELGHRAIFFTAGKP
jgi:hypothetical protein